MKKAKTTTEPQARKKRWERKVGHRSRVEKLKAGPVVRQGKIMANKG